MTFKVSFEYGLQSPVLIKAIDRPGIVTGVLRDSDGEQYRERKTEWLYAHELKATEPS